MAKVKLTDKQRAFINAYVQCWNASEAARQAGYSEKTAAVIGYENLTKPYIWEHIEQRMVENAMQANEVLSRLSDQARADMGDFIEVRHNYANIDLEKAKELGLLRHVKKFKVTRQGTEVELYSSQSALQTLAKAHGLLKDTEINININFELVNRVWSALEQAGKNPEAVLSRLAEQAERVH